MPQTPKSKSTKPHPLDETPLRLRTPTAAGDGWDKIEEMLAKLREEKGSKASRRQTPPVK